MDLGWVGWDGDRQAKTGVGWEGRFSGRAWTWCACEELQDPLPPVTMAG